MWKKKIYMENTWKYLICCSCPRKVRGASNGASAPASCLCPILTCFWWAFLGVRERVNSRLPCIFPLLWHIWGPIISLPLHIMGWKMLQMQDKTCVLTLLEKENLSTWGGRWYHCQPWWYHKGRWDLAHPRRHHQGLIKCWSVEWCQIIFSQSGPFAIAGNGTWIYQVTLLLRTTGHRSSEEEKV